MSNVKILHITNNDFDGAGRAVLRLHNGLLNSGIDSKVLVLHRENKEEYAKTIGLSKLANSGIFEYALLFYSKLQTKFYQFRFKPKFLFNFNLVSVNFNKLSGYLHDTDIVFFHNIHGILSADDIYKIHKKFSVRIYYHLFDMNPITGGCHFNHGCNNYIDDCKQCPQLSSNNVANKILENKKEVYRKIPINWFVKNYFSLDLLKKSLVYSKIHSVNVVYMGIEPDRFTYIDQKNARDMLSFSKKKILLFGCLNFMDKRKGAYLLKSILKNSMINNSDFHDVHLVTFGKLNGFSFKDVPSQWTHMGSINSSKEMNILYRAADLLVSPSTDDLGPTIVQEAFMNHLPIVAFNTGVAKDLVRNKVNGVLVSCFSSHEFRRAIFNCLSNIEKLDYKDNSDLLLVKNRCSMEDEAKEFLKLIN